MKGHKHEPAFTTKVTKDVEEWNEWQVRLYRDGAFVDNSTYHTSDPKDALETAEEMTRHALKVWRNEHAHAVTPVHDYEVTYSFTVSALNEKSARKAGEVIRREATKCASSITRLKRAKKSRTSMTMQEELAEYGGDVVYIGKAKKAGVGGWRYKRMLYSKWSEQYKMFESFGPKAIHALEISIAEVWHITDSAYVWVKNRRSE